MIDALVSALLIYAVGRITLRLERDGVALRRPVRMIGTLAYALRWTGPVFIGWTLIAIVDPGFASKSTKIWIDLAWALFWCPMVLTWVFMVPKEEVFRPWNDALDRQAAAPRG